jgi:hypothetical protein
MINSEQKLITIKIIHTIIWIFFNAVLFYMAYAVIVNKMDTLVWMGLAFIITEGVVLWIFKMKCPLTILARKYSDSTKDNFDIYIPNWLAKHNKLIYTAFFTIVMAGILIRTFKL